MKLFEKNDTCLQDIVWEGSPNYKQLSVTTKIGMSTGIFFMFAVLALIYEIFLQEKKLVFLYLMFIVVVVVSVSLILILPILELKIRENTHFVITRNEIVSFVGRKIKITRITPSLFFVIVNNPISCTCTIGFNVKKRILLDRFNPVIWYFIFNFENYMHFFYDIKDDGEDIIQMIKKLKDEQ